MSNKMNTRSLFKDKYSEMFLEQIQKAQYKVHSFLDKEIVAQLILLLIEKGFIPVLKYSSEQVGTLPLAYSYKRGRSMSVNIPVPIVVLWTVENFEDEDKFEKAKEELIEEVAKFRG